MKRIYKMIEEAESIAILTHINSDGDALGSSFGLLGSLKQMGKNAVCILQAPPEDRLKFLTEEYLPLENVGEERFDLCFSVDSADKNRLGEAVGIFENSKKTICIDHHKTNVGYADVNIVRGEASSAGEVIFEVLEENQIPLDNVSAMRLYAAIASDSGCFKYSNTSRKTMEIAARLLSYDFNHAEILRQLFDVEKPEVLKLKGYLMNHIESYEDGKIQVITSDEALLERFGVSKADASNFVDIPRRVLGCEIALEVKKRDGKIRISMRADTEGIDVSEIAAYFGGGGHKKAAGADVKAEKIEEAKEEVLKLCRKALAEKYDNKKI